MGRQDNDGSDRREQDRLALDVLTVALGLSAWVAFGSLVLATVDGLGEHPLRRWLIGAALVSASVLALVERRRVCDALGRRPWLVVVVAAAQIAAACLDQPVGGAFVAVSLTSIGLAVVAARAATVWACVAVLVAGYALAVFPGHSPAQLADDGDLGGVLGVLLSYVVIALLLLGLRRLFKRFADSAEEILLAIRAGAPTLTPALAQAVAHPGGPLLLTAAPAAPVRLTPTEIRVVEGLAAGSAPKQLAREMNVGITTIRTHIKHAKRKTGAHTLRELAGLATHAGWPDLAKLP